MDLVISTLSALIVYLYVRPQLDLKSCLLLVVLVYVCFKSYRIFIHPKYLSPLRHLPGPTDNHFFFGQFLKLCRAETPVALQLKWMRENPDAPLLRYLSFANTEVVMVNSEVAYKEVLQSQCYSLKKPDTWRRMVKDLVGKGVLMLEFDEHRFHRKTRFDPDPAQDTSAVERQLTPGAAVLNGAFSPSNIRRLGHLFRTKASELGFLFDRAIEAGLDGKTGVIDCTDIFCKATLDTIVVALFGIDPGHVRDTTFASEGQDGTEYTFQDAYAHVFGPDTMGKILMFIDGYFPIRWIPLKANREFIFAAKWTIDVVTHLIRQRQAEMAKVKESGEKGKELSSDVLSFVLQESSEGGAIEGMTDEYILGHMLVLLAGGHDTTASTVSWCVYELTKRPEVQNRLRQELRELEDRRPDPTCDDIEALPYLSNFIKEVLRVYPPSANLPRQAAADVFVEGFRIPKGTAVDAVPAMISVNPLIWGDDAQEFRPERWNHLTKLQSSPYSYQAFSSGPRACLGKQFALHEIRAVLFEIVRRYRFLRVEGPFTIENPALSFRPCGLKIRFERISDP